MLVNTYSILQENTLKRLQGNLIKTGMGIGKTCSRLYGLY